MQTKRVTMTFSDSEKHDLFIAWLLLSLAFGIADLVINDVALQLATVWPAALMAGCTVGIAFFVHELAHKYVAQRYGKYAEFKAFVPWLVIGLLLAFAYRALGILLVLPGAVFISGYSTKRETGHIAIAGPLSNVVLALLAVPAILVFTTGLAAAFLQQFYFINVWLALFNMLPFFVFDGKKIIDWSKKWYFATLALILVLFFAQTILFA
jgi:Zn-dependent protease